MGSGKYLGNRKHCENIWFCIRKYKVAILGLFAIQVVPPAQILALLQPHQLYPTVGRSSYYTIAHFIHNLCHSGASRSYAESPLIRNFQRV